MKKLFLLANSFGINIKTVLRSIKGWPYFWRDWRAFRQLIKGRTEFAVSWYPVLRERFEQSALLKGHYFHQDLLVARRVFENSPLLHVDVGSRVDGFVAHVASFRTIEVYDIRPQESSVRNIRFLQGDFMNGDQLPTAYCDSLSSLNVIEHFGLGRYGDPLLYDGHIYGLDNMYRLLKPGGRFYFSTPIGPQRIEFNAHRVFSVRYLLNLFKDRYEIVHFSFVDDKGDLFENVELAEPQIQNNFGCTFGCGIFEMIRK